MDLSQSASADLRFQTAIDCRVSNVIIPHSPRQQRGGGAVFAPVIHPGDPAGRGQIVQDALDAPPLLPVVVALGGQFGAQPVQPLLHAVAFDHLMHGKEAVAQQGGGETGAGKLPPPSSLALLSRVRLAWDEASRSV